MAKKNSSNNKQNASGPSSGDRDAALASGAEPARPRPQALAGYRESVESICVAIILALLFRSFVAEAFVIPTGSMAPTLMGAHKDLFCDECGCNFRVGASIEQRGPQAYEDPLTGGQGYRDSQNVLGGRCPNCRKQNVLRLASDANDRTFSGDRILVSKFSYALQEPQRWDVIVFKYPGNPKQNYIKRLVGLPNETLKVQYGDVYVKGPDASDFTIARKPDHKVLPTSHLVFDSRFQADDLLAAKYPSRLQPWRFGATSPPNDSWEITRTADGMTATFAAPEPNSDQPQWLRYYHNPPTDREREAIEAGASMEGIDGYRSQAITDFYAYNTYFTVDRNLVMGRSGLRADYTDGQYPTTPYDNGFLTGSYHWVGDLTFEVDLETEASAKGVTLEIVEAGIRYQCLIDLASGTATLSILGDVAESFDGDRATVTAATDVRAGQEHTLQFSNVDNQLRLWVDGDPVLFDAPATYDPFQFTTDHQSRPHTSATHPLDAAPVGLAVDGGATVSHFSLYRDQYYIATKGSVPMTDYAGSYNLMDVHTVLESPELWDASKVWAARRSIEFSLEEDQFFPMGDNSPESKDARCWVDSFHKDVPDEDAYKFAKSSFVPRDLLVGKALLVFWPHPWRTPVPYTPNVRRMKMIR